MGCGPSTGRHATQGAGAATKAAPASVSSHTGAAAGTDASRTQPFVIATRRSCPFTARLAVVLTFKGVPFSIVDVGPADTSPAWVFDSSPNGSVPILMRLSNSGQLVKAFPNSENSGKAIEWLEQQYPVPTLYPSGHRDTVQEWATFADTELKMAIAKNMLASPFPMQQQWRPKLKAALQKLNDGLAQHNPNQGPYFLGDTFSLIDVMAVSFVERMPALKYFRNFEPDDAALPHLAHYRHGMAEWPMWKPHKYDPAVLRAHLKETVNPLPPMSMTRLQHACFRQWAQRIDAAAAAARTAPSDANVADLLRLLNAYVTLLEAHTVMENDVLLPMLEDMKPGCTAPIRAEHEDDGPKLRSLKDRMREASESKEGSSERQGTVDALAKEAHDLLHHLNEHYTMEEKNIGPVVKQLPKEKHPETFVRCLSHYQGQVNRECLPAMLQVLGPAWAGQYVLNYFNAGKGTGDFTLWEDVVSILADSEAVSEAQLEDLKERIPALEGALQKHEGKAQSWKQVRRKRKAHK